MKIIHNFVRTNGDKIQSILPPLPNHPTRQAQAHLYREIKLRFGVPAIDVRDCRFEEVMTLLQICVDHAADPDIKRHLQWVVPEPPREGLSSLFEE